MHGLTNRWCSLVVLWSSWEEISWWSSVWQTPQSPPPQWLLCHRWECSLLFPRLVFLIVVIVLDLNVIMCSVGVGFVFFFKYFYNSSVPQASKLTQLLSVFKFVYTLSEQNEWQPPPNTGKNLVLIISNLMLGNLLLLYRYFTFYSFTTPLYFTLLLV